MFWTDAGAWHLSGTDPGPGTCCQEGWLKPEGACEDPEYQAAHGKGKETKAKALERIHKNEAVMLEGFSEAEQCLLRRFLEQILANIEKIQPEEFTGKTPMEEITEKEEQKRD